MRSVVLVTLLVVTRAAFASAVFEPPPGKDPVPLVVVLHGDREHAPAAAARWHAAVKKKGWALLALECPADQGCKDSWWRWDGDPSWIGDQIDAVAKRRAIDRKHVYLVGWSGGGSYIGYRAQAWASRFAALVIHGGGMAPSSSDCPDPAIPVYFLVGDRNPLHHLAKALRSYFDGCKQDVVWDLVKDGDHEKEEAALTTKKAEAILGWLAERAR
jgi:poly(3-hydroxybutyrate) depolymerase